jgi:hypothetical protein
MEVKVSRKKFNELAKSNQKHQPDIGISPDGLYLINKSCVNATSPGDVDGLCCCNQSCPFFKAKTDFTDTDKASELKITCHFSGAQGVSLATVTIKGE